MPALTPEQGNDLVQRGFDLLKDAANLTSGNDAEYIRDGAPTSLFEALPLAAARQGCRRYADKGGNYPPNRAARAERACRPYLDSLNYGEPPAIAQPFDGGQCPGVNYRISWTWRAGNFNPGPQQADRVGPLSFSRAGTGSEDCGPNGGTYNVFTVIDGTGNSPVSLAAGCGAELLSLSVARVDGGADICGNPPPEYTPPKPPALPGPPREPFNPSPNIDVDIAVEVNIDGTINVDFGTGPVTIDPFGDGGPGGGGGGVGGGDLVPDGGTAGDPSDTGDGGTASGDAPPGQELVGVRVEILERPVGFNQYGNNAAEVIRGVGYVRMGYPGRLALDMGGAAVISPQFFLAPVRGLTSWEVRANLGFINRVTPFYRELPS